MLGGNIMNDIMTLINVLWMLTTASIALGIVGLFNGIWKDIFG